jgi:hypothetical protein
MYKSEKILSTTRLKCLRTCFSVTKLTIGKIVKTTVTFTSFYCSAAWSVAVERRYVALRLSCMGAFSRGVDVGRSSCSAVSVCLVALHIAFSSKIYACSRCHLHGGAEPHGDPCEDSHWMSCCVYTARQMRSAERSAGWFCEAKWLVDDTKCSHRAVLRLFRFRQV